MPTAVETLQTAEQHSQRMLQLITDAEQTLEQLHACYEEYQKDNPDPSGLMDSIKALREGVKALTDRHNEVVGKLRQAQEDAANQTYNPDTI